ncbi:MAG: DUF721 domain-containing protein [Gemmatimonadetes bacterium]|nr:DUF721 domain-containing protein [Gemmatimonadota bacterium]
MSGRGGRRKSGLEPMATVLSDVLDEAGVADHVERVRVLELWPEIVGDQVARVTRARSVDESTLIVEVRNSAWLMELNMLKGDIIGRANERLDDVSVDKIVFVLAETE